MSNSLRPPGLQYTTLPCPSPTPWVCSNSCPLSQWYHRNISSSVVPFSCLQSFPASGPFPMSQFFTLCDQSIRTSVSTSVLSMIIQDWLPLGLTVLISLKSRDSQEFPNIIVQKQGAMNLLMKKYTIHYSTLKQRFNLKCNLWVQQIICRKYRRSRICWTEALIFNLPKPRQWETQGTWVF